MLIPNGYTNVSLRQLLKNLWDAKDFAMPPEVDPNAGKTQPGSYNGLRCAHKSSNVFMIFYDVLTITSELWNFGKVWGLLNHVSIDNPLRDSVTPT